MRTSRQNVFARYQRSEQALVLALVEMVIQDVSTRKISAIMEDLCGDEFSKSTVSDLCTRQDPIVADYMDKRQKQSLGWSMDVTMLRR